MKQSLYVLILAGGSGERFWPLSRRARPKQLLALFSETTLLEDTLSRLDGLVPREHVFILTNQEQEKAVRALAARLPAENVVAEPAKRDTAAAIALGVAWVAMRDPEATMVVLPADHLIKDTAAFQRTLRTAAAAAEQSGDLVTIGITPTWACPGFGYIEQGAEVKSAAGGGPRVFEVARFREKPDAKTAAAFFSQGNFWWNAGMFIWQVPAIRKELASHAPELAQFIDDAVTAGQLEPLLSNRFPQLPKISVDYAVMEKAARVLMVEAAFDWDDVGGWTAVARYFPDDGQGNQSNRGELTAIESANNIVYTSGHPRVALLGVRDLIIVQTDDALLVCHRDEAEKIKQLVGKVPPELQ